jgi:hypothetical protein
MPGQSEPLQRSWMAAALSVGTELVRLRGIAERFGISTELEAASQSLARGDSATAIERLMRFDEALAAIGVDRPGIMVRLRARGSIIAVSEALTRHREYFDWQ